MKKFCAVVVTYNRKNLLIECLNGLLKQKHLNKIIIIDNASTDGTEKLLFEKKFLNEICVNNNEKIWETKNKINNIEIQYIKLYKNLGGSGGFYEGIKRAYEEGFEWIWIMDDDAEPEETCLEKMVNFWKEIKQKTNENEEVVLVPLKVNKEGRILKNHTGIFDQNKFKIIFPKNELSKKLIRVDFSSFVGPMFHRKVIQKIGLPKKEFFIHHDDVEYSLRIKNSNIPMYLIQEAKIIHKEERISNSKKINILNKKIPIIPYEKYWLTYYGRRNKIWILKRYYNNELYKSIIFDFIKSMLKIWLFSDKKIKRSKLIIHAIIDGLKENFDNEKPKKILYKN